MNLNSPSFHKLMVYTYIYLYWLPFFQILYVSLGHIRDRNGTTKRKQNGKNKMEENYRHTHPMMWIPISSRHKNPVTCRGCLVTGVRCGFFLVTTAAHDGREWQRVILAGHCLSPRQRHSTGVGSLQGSWRHVQLAIVHILCGPKWPPNEAGCVHVDPSFLFHATNQNTL